MEKINIEEPAYGENFKEFYSLIGRLKEQNKIIYEQKEDLRLRKKQFSAITDNMSEGFLLVDYNMQVLSFNQSAVKFLFGGEKVQSHLKKSSCEPRVVKSVENALAGKTVFVHGVYQFLREMVFNLCDNAVKYNKIGGSVKLMLVLKLR